LPNVIVNDIAIQANSGVLRAGTFGRGLWESPLLDPLVLGVENVTNEYVEVYPNPADDMIHIMGLNAAGKSIDINLYNASGRQVFSDQIFVSNSRNAMYNIPVHQLSSGVYILRITGQTTNLTNKVVVAK